MKNFFYFNETKKINVLLADDRMHRTPMLKKAIDQLHYNTNVSTVSNGKELMDNLYNPNLELPHMLFIDLTTPMKTGLSYLAEIRKNEQFNALSLIISSNSSNENDIEESFLNGANVYIRRPGNFDKLKDILSKVICINWQYLGSGMNRENFILSI
ncbi:MAG: response regulator [Cyclobacteriaceae bacterium]